jgi:hypothetical protein
MKMVPLNGRPLGLLGWLLSLLLGLAVSESAKPEPGTEGGVLVARGQETPVMERKAA